jgi:hypothetical protein
MEKDLRRIENLIDGEYGFVYPAWFHVDTDFHVYVDTQAVVLTEPFGNTEEKDIPYVIKMEDGLYVRLAADYQYSPYKLSAVAKMIKIDKIIGQDGPLLPPHLLKINQMETMQSQEYDKVLLLKDKAENNKNEDIKGKKIIELDDDEHGYISADDTFVDTNLNLYVDCDAIASEFPTDVNCVLVQKTKSGYSIALDMQHKYLPLDMTEISKKPVLMVTSIIGLLESTLPIDFLDLGVDPTECAAFEQLQEREIQSMPIENDIVSEYFYDDKNNTYNELDDDELDFSDLINEYEKKNNNLSESVVDSALIESN